MSEKSQFTLRSLLEKEKLKSDGSNFIDWYRNVRIVLRQEQKDKVLTTAPPKEPASDATQEAKDAYTKATELEVQVQCLLVSSMDSELQKRFEYDLPYDTMEQLKKMFQEQARVERFNVTKSLISCKLSEEPHSDLAWVWNLPYMKLGLFHSPISHLIFKHNPAPKARSQRRTAGISFSPTILFDTYPDTLLPKSDPYLLL